MNLQKLKTNLFIIIALVAVISGYAFFFLSPRLFSVDESNLKHSDLTHPFTIDSSHSFTIEEWQYDKAHKKMGIIISFESTAANPSEKYVYQIISRNKVKERKEISYEVTYQSSRFATLMVNNVPEDFVEMALSVGFVDKHLDEEEGSDLKAAFATALTNKNVVEKSDSIEQMSVLELYSARISKENDLLKEENASLESEIVDLQTQMQDILATVSELRKSEVYVSEAEKAEIEKKINSYQSTYDGCQSQVVKDQGKIGENNTVIESNDAKIKELNKIIMEGGEAE